VTIGVIYGGAGTPVFGLGVLYLHFSGHWWRIRGQQRRSADQHGPSTRVVETGLYADEWLWPKTNTRAVLMVHVLQTEPYGIGYSSIVSFSLSLSLSLGGDLSVWNWKRIKSSGSVLYWNSVQVDWWFNNRGHRTILLYWTIVNFIIIIIIIIIINNEFVYVMFIPHPPWPLLINDVGLELEGTLINCSLL